jgi:hypothetical protein
MLEFTNPAELSYKDFDVTVPIISWEYRLRQFDVPDVPICPETCRPYYVDRAKNVPWHQASRWIFGDVANQIHIHWYFIQCVRKLKSFPSKGEFLLFVFNGLVPKRKASLPFLTERFIDVVFKGYANIVTAMTPEEFIATAAASERPRARASMESGSRKRPR